MIDADAMQDYIREANPVPDLEQIDSDELARLVALVARPPTANVVDAQPSHGQERWRRGPVLAVATAAIALGAVAIAVVLAQTFGSDEVVSDEPSPVASPAAEATSSVPSAALHTQRLIPVADANPPPLATAIGDLEFEVLEFESPEYALWEVAWAGHSFVSIADGRLYWSTDYYNWESVGPVDGDEIAVAGDDLIVHGGPGDPTRYSWIGDSWVESGLVLAGDVGQFVFGEEGAVALGGDTFLYSSDGLMFNPAEQPPTRLETAERGGCPEGWGPDLTESLAATKVGYIALLPTSSAWWSTEPVCEPVVWASADGSSWDLVAAESPFGEDSVVYRVAARDGRVVAAGALPGAPAVIWVSDDGVDWERIDIGLEVIDGLAAGEMGWLISGGSTEYAQQLIMVSADGINWVGPYGRPVALRTGYLPPQFAVGDNVILGTGGDGDALLVRVED